MSKRKHDEDVHSDRKLRAAPAWERDNRTVAQLATGSIGIHRVAYPRASLLGLPREIRDLIYSYIPHEISCVPEDSQSHRIRYPRDAVPYTNDCPSPAIYEGALMGHQVVDELAHLASAQGWHRHPMFNVCRQLSKEYLDFFHKHSFQAQRIHFLVRGFNFETVIRVVKKWRPAHVVIELCDNYFWQEGAAQNLRRWYKSCRTPSLARPDQAEIGGHQCKLTYQRQLRYHSPSLLARGRQHQCDMLLEISRIRLGLSLMAPTSSERNTREAIRRHLCKAIQWIDTYNGNRARAWESWIKAAKRDVKVARKNKLRSGLAKTSKLLGRKRDFEDMEAGGREDPLDAKMRAVVKRWAALKFQPTTADFRAAEAGAPSEISGESRNTERLAELLSSHTEPMDGVQTQNDIELDSILEQLGKMDLKGLGSKRVDAAGIYAADEMEIEPKEVVNGKDIWGLNLKIVIEQISKLSLVG